MAAISVINTRKMRYTGAAMEAFKTSKVKAPRNLVKSQDIVPAKSYIDYTENPFNRFWIKRELQLSPPRITDGLRHQIGTYPLTSDLALWVRQVAVNYQPNDQVQELVGPFSLDLHEFFERERKKSSGFHDLNLLELMYQIALEVGAEILLVADAADDPIDIQIKLHSSKAARDDHLAPWGKLLTGLECNPPIIAQFPVYLMMCQSFTFDHASTTEDYVYSALSGIDWAKGKGVFSQKFQAFEKLAWSSVPNLDDALSGQDRSFWRVSLAYLRIMNDCDNSREFRSPKKASIKHDIDDDLVIAARAVDTVGSAYMSGDGAAWLDEAGFDSLLGSGLVNDIMDLHTDILTGETRNVLRLLYPDDLSLDQAMQTVSTLFAGTLCEVFRGHHRARFGNREDGRIAATAPSYSFCRARHRRIFETLEAYSNRYPEFWEWTWDIYHRTKEQITEAGLNEPLAEALKRAQRREPLPPSPANNFYELYWDMIENGSAQINEEKPLGVSEDLGEIVIKIHSLWHEKLLNADKQPGWGRDFDIQSDMLFAEAGNKFLEKGDISDDVYKFAIAYGRLSMSLPYVAYHTIDAIIMAFGVIE